MWVSCASTCREHLVERIEQKIKFLAFCDFCFVYSEKHWQATRCKSMEGSIVNAARCSAFFENAKCPPYRRFVAAPRHHRTLNNCFHGYLSRFLAASFSAKIVLYKRRSFLTLAIGIWLDTTSGESWFVFVRSAGSLGSCTCRILAVHSGQQGRFPAFALETNCSVNFPHHAHSLCSAREL